MADEGVEVRIKGIRQLSAGTRDLFRNIERATVQDAVRVSAEQTVQSMRVPVRSGRLKASVRVAMRGKVAQVQMGAGVPYAGWIEFGGSRGRRQVRRGRYEYPAAKRTERAFLRHCETATTGEIRSMRWPTPR
jgi:phage gpG-like protein